MRTPAASLRAARSSAYRRSWRALRGEPERLRSAQRRDPFVLTALLDAVARELDVLACERRIECAERGPVSPFAEQLEVVDAEPIGKRRIGPPGDIRLDLVGARGVQVQVKLPIF